MRLVDFFLEEQDEEAIVIRKNERFEIRYPQSDASIFMLTKCLTGRLMEPLIEHVSSLDQEAVDSIPVVLEEKNLVM
jgi:hypothetical protein